MDLPIMSDSSMEAVINAPFEVIDRLGAGGLGINTGLTQRTPEPLAKEIARCHGLTGVDLTFPATCSAPPYPEYIAAIK